MTDNEMSAPSSRDAAHGKRGLRWWQWALGAVVGVAVIGSLGQRPQPASEMPPPTAAANANPPEITMEEFTKLKTGITPDEAASVIGSPGVVLSESDLAGYHSVMYKWDGGSMGSNANATFQNGKLVSKAQFGLK